MNMPLKPLVAAAPQKLAVLAERLKPFSQLLKVKKKFRNAEATCVDVPVIAVPLICVRFAGEAVWTLPVRLPVKVVVIGAPAVVAQSREESTMIHVMMTVEEVRQNVKLLTTYIDSYDFTVKSVEEYAKAHPDEVFVTARDPRSAHPLYGSMVKKRRKAKMRIH